MVRKLINGFASPRISRGEGVLCQPGSPERKSQVLVFKGEKRFVEEIPPLDITQTKGSNMKKVTWKPSNKHSAEAFAEYVERTTGVKQLRRNGYGGVVTSNGYLSDWGKKYVA